MSLARWIKWVLGDESRLCFDSPQESWFLRKDDPAFDLRLRAFDLMQRKAGQ